MFAGNKVGTDLALPAATARGTKTCESCNGRDTTEAIAHSTLDRCERRDDRGCGRGGGRDRDRTSYSSNWCHGGHCDGHNSGNGRRDDHARCYDARGYDARSKGGGRDRDRTNFSSGQHRDGGGRGNGYSGRGGHAAFSTRDATLFNAHANYDGEASSSALMGTSSAALMLGLRAEYEEEDSPSTTRLHRPMPFASAPSNVRPAGRV